MTIPHRISAALERARDDRAAKRPFPGPEGRVRRVVAAFGDPQAPFPLLLRILDRHHLLGEDGRIRPDARLFSLGDHFDYGPQQIREEAGQMGILTLSWLASHPSDQVIILFGNHDLARAQELMRFDDQAFSALHEEALAAYRARKEAPELEADFIRRHPMFPSSEVVARDYATYDTEQRDLVVRILQARRACIAQARDPSLLLVHAGVTVSDLALAGLPSSDASDAVAAAEALNRFFDRAIDAWDPKKREPLDLSPLHVSGSAVAGEGRGILYQRPGNPEINRADLFQGPPRRRFDPRTIPLGMTQAIGHIRDEKCRKLLGSWARNEPSIDGPLRTLSTDGTKVQYAFGVPEGIVAPNEGRILFLDGGMNAADPERYQLLDVALKRPLDPALV